MKVKMADGIDVYLCANCNDVHIAFSKDGKFFAEAIPTDIGGFALALADAIEQRAKRLAAQKLN